MKRKREETRLYKIADKIRSAILTTYRLDAIQHKASTLALSSASISRLAGYLDKAPTSYAMNSRMRYELQGLQNTVEGLQAVYTRSKDACSVSSAKDIYLDLQSLEAEFAKVEVGKDTIQVTIEPVTLENVYLGAFQIILDTRYSFDSRRCYRVVALDPHPAAKDDKVTHPHVQDETLCEGDATRPIRQAIQTGRLLDFFTLIRSVLETYNEHSPYVKLEDWEGPHAECSDCGCGLDEDDVYSCNHCSETLCESCGYYCDHCESSYCGSCADTCHECRSYTCPSCEPCPACHKATCHECRQSCSICDKDICVSCMSACVDCRGDACGDCLDDNGRCPDCAAVEAESAKETETTETEASNV